MRRAARSRRKPATRWPTPTASCAGSRTACRCCATRRRTRCPTTDARPRSASRAGSAIADWDALRAALDAHRARVADEFDALLAPRGRAAAPERLADLLARAARCGRQRRRWPTPASSTAENARRQPARLRARARRARACPTRRARAWTACCRRCCRRPRVRRNPMRRCAACWRCCTRCCAARATSRCSTNSRRRWRGWSTWSRAARCWPNAWPRIRCCSTNCSIARVAGAAARIATRSRAACARGAAATTTPRPCCRRSTKSARR